MRAARAGCGQVAELEYVARDESRISTDLHEFTALGHGSTSIAPEVEKFFGRNPRPIRRFTPLVENAARHASTAVAIRTCERDGSTGIIVADDGPGIPPERLDEALLRGGQLDRSGGGAGLGLAIVRDIAEAWGGRFDLRTGPAGLEAELGIRR